MTLLFFMHKVLLLKVKQLFLSINDLVLIRFVPQILSIELPCIKQKHSISSINVEFRSQPKKIPKTFTNKHIWQVRI